MLLEYDGASGSSSVMSRPDSTSNQDISNLRFTVSSMPFAFHTTSSYPPPSLYSFPPQHTGFPLATSSEPLSCPSNEQSHNYMAKALPTAIHLLKHRRGKPGISNKHLKRTGEGAVQSWYLFDIKSSKSLCFQARGALARDVRDSCPAAHLDPS
jgi:hypothetical protein